MFVAASKAEQISIEQLKKFLQHNQSIQRERFMETILKSIAAEVSDEILGRLKPHPLLLRKQIDLPSLEQTIALLILS